MTKLVWVAMSLLMVTAVACDNNKPNTQYPRPGYPPQPGYPPRPGYPPQPGYQPPQPGYPPQPGQPPPQGGAPLPQPPPLAPSPPVHNDPLNQLNIGFMRQRAQGVLTELVAALPLNQKAMVQSVPLMVDDTVGEVNAFAACIDGKALMAISDGLLEIQAQMARARANDEVFGTRKFDEYIAFVAKNQRPKTPVVRPAPNFFNPVQDVDGRKVQRQHQLFDEELAFVLGHELAHHYLLHTGCAGPHSAGITPSDLGRVLSRAVPGFNQPNEISSDTNGTNNLLTAGSRRNGYKWTEGGALLTLNFFLALKSMTPAEAIIFGFELSHPHPSFRIPIVQNTANQWRQSGGKSAPWNPFQIPGLNLN